MKKNNQKRRKQIKKRPASNTDGWKVTPNAVSRLPRSVNVIMPDRLMTRLSYKGVTTLVVAASTANISARWQPSAAYDVDPALGGFTMPGFNELGGIYNRYRVVKSNMTVRFSNQSTQPMTGVMIALSTDPGSSPTSATINSWVNNPYSKNKLIPSVGGPTVSVSGSMTTEKIYGTKNVYFDDDYASVTNAIPVLNWYWAVGLSSPSVVGSACTVVTQINITIDLEFFNRRNLLS